MNLDVESRRSLERILASTDLSALDKAERALFETRLHEHFPLLFKLLFEVYGHRYDYYFYLQQLVSTLAQGFSTRSKKLKKKDQLRLAKPNWYLQQNMLGMACYADLFSGNLRSLVSKIPYLRSLGVTYLHLMPLYDAPKGDSDGGYAVSDYRKVNPRLGSIEDLRLLSDELNNAGISLVLDFVFNHTSDEHRWAMEAKRGNQEYQDFYYMFNDRGLPDLYEQNLREIFPQVRRGNFTWNEQASKWVWTTFNGFQWDLNYANPCVFNAITDEMIFLANLGCEALRLDALAFIWKEVGTNCENQPKAHTLIRAFNACLRIVAPAVVFKSEAIVHPDEVVKYIARQECELSYNPLLMALIWNSLATRKTDLLTLSMRKSFPIPQDCAWVNYVRCHDDIGWTFDDDLARQLGINPQDHRHFLNQFYTGRFPGTFASGVPFGENPNTGDCRVCGSLASLAGLEKGLQKQNQGLIDDAVKRILLVHGIILSIGGIPLIYSGDELGLLNDYSYKEDVSKSNDDRWVHRLPITDQAIHQSQQRGSPEQAIAEGLKRLIQIRKQHKIFGQADTLILDTNNQHVFAYARHDDAGNKLLALNNFTEQPQAVDSRILEHLGDVYGKDLISGESFSEQDKAIIMQPYQLLWLTSQR